MVKPSVLIVDDERNTREGLRKAFRAKYEMFTAESAEQGLEILDENKIDVVLTDLRMPGMDGLAFVRKVRGRNNPPVMILFTAYGTIQTAVQAIKEGAFDYMAKPLNLENLEILIDRGLEQRAEDSQEREENTNQSFCGILGQSEPMKEVFEAVKQVAPTKSNVLLTGESGTGKELVAHALHKLGNRKNHPFVVVHCASLNPNILESELFGHEKGAYTGAQAQKKGRFEKADGGTLFLDEIGEIDTSTQVKLLRVLETRTFERVGGTEPVNVDVRLIAATNRNLWEEVQEGVFREDLYYRLNVVNIELPPLRERGEDVSLLLNHYLKIAAEENGKTCDGFSDEAINLLCAYPWPGNVRELRNCVERMVVMSRGPMLSIGDIPYDIRTRLFDEYAGDDKSDDHFSQQNHFEDDHDDDMNLDEQEKHMIIRALEECHGNKTKAAEKLGISRRTMYRKLKTYDLDNLHHESVKPD
jgi:DNA-binding NtrC family response regulator